jgi:hypothetical protein
LYPDWVNLHWVSTDGVDAIMNPHVYPRLIITIVEDKITIVQIIGVENGNVEKFFTIHVNTILIQGNNVSIGTPAKLIGTFTSDGSYITIKTCGINGTRVYKYVLRINSAI